MHGLASNTLEAVGILDHLLPNIALCVFDFAGSGRSRGSICTYGLKEHEDIVAVLDRLETEGFRQFVIWGRSMGAVACLLHGFISERKGWSCRWLTRPSPLSSQSANFMRKGSWVFPSYWSVLHYLSSKIHLLVNLWREVFQHFPSRSFDWIKFRGCADSDPGNFRSVLLVSTQ